MSCGRMWWGLIDVLEAGLQGLDKHGRIANAEVIDNH